APGVARSAPRGEPSAALSAEALPDERLCCAAAACVLASPRFSAGSDGLASQRRKFEVPLEFQGLAPPLRDGAEPAELPAPSMIPEKWEPVFRKDHAQTQRSRPHVIQSQRTEV